MNRAQAVEIVKAKLSGYADVNDFNYFHALSTLVPELIDKETEETSDGFHTFGELYKYRLLYNAAFFNSISNFYDVHKSWRHSDGEECFGGGWFIVMAELPTGQISNHYEAKYWDLFKIPVKENANIWDGHTPNDAANRLQKFIEGYVEVENLQ